MNINQFIKSTALLLVLLNPFLIILYLLDVVQKLQIKQFIHVILRAGIIATITFIIFAVIGDFIFSNIIQAEFASFQIFGGLIFLIIGIQFVLKGPTAIEILRGDSEYLSGAIAMPILVGPGSISASIIIGKHHTPLVASISIVTAILTSISIIILLKVVHDYIRQNKEPLIQRYIEIAGRMMALIVGTISIDMIMQGIKIWLSKL
jgi:small neutral amino acid transporter SnatA (MarC family)